MDYDETYNIDRSTFVIYDDFRLISTYFSINHLWTYVCRPLGHSTAYQPHLGYICISAIRGHVYIFHRGTCVCPPSGDIRITTIGAHLYINHLGTYTIRRPLGHSTAYQQFGGICISIIGAQEFGTDI